MEETFIYTLSCPESNEVKYVGKSNNPRKRFNEHLRMCDRNIDKNNWIYNLKCNDKIPILIIVEKVLISEWKDKEKFYISTYRNMGLHLFNTSIGGEGLDFGNQTSFKKGNGSRKVICLLSDGTIHNTFNSTIEAASYINKHNIDYALSGKVKKSGGYIWIYQDKYILMNENEKLNFINNCNHNKSMDKGTSNKGSFIKGHNTWNKGIVGIKLKPNKNVHQFSLDNIFIKTWNTAKEASIQITGNVNGEHNISKCARGNSNMAFKYKWSYIINI